MVSILGVSGLEMYSSGFEPVTTFGAQSWLGGAQISFGGVQAVIWGRARPRNAPQWHRSCYHLFGNFFLGFGP